MRRVPFLLIFCLLAAAGLRAQLVDYAQGQLIVQLKPDTDGKAWAVSKSELLGWKPLNRGINAWLVTFDWATYAEGELRGRYTRDPRVITVQLNHRLSMRRRPNDPRYDRQWQFFNTGQIGGNPGADHNVEPAWEITTGGVTANGDTIVIASIDNGIDLDHEDLVPNIWINRDEIPGNGRDDDRNGYVDDRYGWNTALDNNDVEGGKGDHGTPVMGQIAAAGNNALGVTGVNWSAKVMTITNDFDPLESEVVEAYGYALDARVRYDATGGREGAYVVATNASWGRDRAFPSQSPIWCALYDTLGHHGIINIAAVPNRDLDVDEVGDLPSLCGSEYLVVVTSIDTRNKKVKDAAAGASSVDLAAFGEGVYTTLLGNGYGQVFGTSFAAPAVSGAFGLLYSAPCASFGRLLVSDPPAAARYLRDVLFATVRPLPTLTEATVTGGALDVGTAMQRLMTGCNDCLAPTSFTASPPGDGSSDLLLNWNVTSASTRTELRYRRTGEEDWSIVANVASPYRLTGLPTCSEYDLKLVSFCAADSSRSEVLTVETPGCCRLPDDYRVSALAGGRIVAEWNPLLNAESYTLRYRTVDEEDWTEINTSDSRYEITGLRNCRTYQIELRTNCTGGATRFQGRRVQKTLGCGVCLDSDYCRPSGFGNEQEWIARVEIPGILDVASEREINGYRNYGDQTTASMVPGGVYSIVLTPNFRANGFTEDFHVYIDWNQDGTFAEDELVTQQVPANGQPARGDFTVPETSELGLTRMRVIMQFTSVKTGPCPAGSNQQFSGEVEDYCLDITPAQGCPAPPSLKVSYDETADATTVTWGASATPGNSYQLRYRPDAQTSFKEVSVEGLSYVLEELNLCASYEVQVASRCAGSPGEYRSAIFGDNCLTNEKGPVPEEDWSVSPNPAGPHTRLTWRSDLILSHLTLLTADGRRVLETAINPQSRELEVRTDDLTPGLYLLRVVDADGRSGVRRLLVH